MAMGRLLTGYAVTFNRRYDPPVAFFGTVKSPLSARRVPIFSAGRADVIQPGVSISVRRGEKILEEMGLRIESIL